MKTELGREIERAVDLSEELSRTVFEMITVELATAITFCQCAPTTEDLDRKGRRLSLAQIAYESAARFKNRVTLTEAMHKEITARELELNSVLLSIRSAPSA